MKIEADSPDVIGHWLYKIIPNHRDRLSCYRPWEYITWGLLGNDDDGIFGEKATAGSRWLERWGGSSTKNSHVYIPGPLSLRRFVCWQLRNPLHNFTFYVVGFADRPGIPLIRLALISTQKLRLIKRMKQRTVFPMGAHTGLYVAFFFTSCRIFPFSSFRLNLCGWKWLEGYLGWRERGNFGIALRIKAMAGDLS